MHYIKVLATDSTNDELKRRLSRNPRMSDTSFFAQHQTKGRGQQNAQWQSKEDKNLLFSILLNNLKVDAKLFFKLNAIISISIRDFLAEKTQQSIFQIKWPNDILSGNLKICGILIENILKGNFITQSVIGIGLNVNQTDFEELPKATSLRKITRIEYDLEELWVGLTQFIQKYIAKYEETTLEDLLEEYSAHLFMKNEHAQFEFPDGNSVTGKITGVSPQGKLQVRLNEGIREFRFKEIKLIY